MKCFKSKYNNTDVNCGLHKYPCIVNYELHKYPYIEDASAPF